MPHVTAGSAPSGKRGARPQPCSSIPVALPLTKFSKSLASNVALILHVPLATTQQAGSPSFRLTISTTVQDPSGQSSVVARYDRETQSCCPSQAALSSLAVPLILMSSLPPPTLPVVTI